MDPEAEILEWGIRTVNAFTFSGCLQNNEVKYFIVEDSGHTIQFGEGANLFNQIWNFFKATGN